MGGGLMQLVAYGAQDIYLTGNPQITFFKVVYRRHTNFSMESIGQTWSGDPSLAKSTKCGANINRNGDLVNGLHIQITSKSHVSKDHFTGCNPGANFIGEHTIELGGQIIDRQTGSWIETWSELTNNNPTGQIAISNASGVSNTLFQRTTCMGGVSKLVSINSNMDKFSKQHVFYVPLQFWFCRNPGLALPLIALQYHEVKFSMEKPIQIWNSAQMTLFADYIYLDTDERRRFAQVSHEYLIEQIQHTSFTTKTNIFELNFNHPVKELIWTGEWKNGFNQSLLSSDSVNNDKWLLQINGHDRLSTRPTTYFTKHQILQHHTGPGGLNSSYSPQGNFFNDSIAVYSFALKPEEHQPSGTCNFSRIENAQLSFTGDPMKLEIYAVNYNILRIMSGMGGLAYSN